MDLRWGRRNGNTWEGLEGRKVEQEMIMITFQLKI